METQRQIEMAEDFFASQAAGTYAPAPAYGATVLPPPVAVTGLAVSGETGEKYNGTVTTFYDAASDTFSETYEPARLTPFGRFWRIESFLIADVWQHVGFVSPIASTPGERDHNKGGWRPFESDALPFIYNPLREREFAQMLLSHNAPRRSIPVGHGLLVFGSPDSISVGVVHVRDSRPAK